jgi:hypothetical protein
MQRKNRLHVARRQQPNQEEKETPTWCFPHPRMNAHPVSSRQLGVRLLCLLLGFGDYMTQAVRHTPPKENANCTRLHSSLTHRAAICPNWAWKL